MNFDLHIQNIGKLTDAKIRIGRFTVFAGPNNTGKSFVSKLLYSLLNATNANHAEIMLRSLTAPLAKFTRNAWAIEQMIKRSSEESLSSIVAHVEDIRVHMHEMGEMVSSCPSENLNAVESLYPGLIQKAENMKILHSKIEAALDDAGEKSRTVEMVRGIYSPELGRHIDELPDKIRSISPKNFIATGMREAIRRSMIFNFQVSSISILGSGKDETPAIGIDGVGEFDFSAEEVGFPEKLIGLQLLQKQSRMIYLESPVYWKLRPALDSALNPELAFASKRERLTGVPGYYYDLTNALKATYYGDALFSDLVEKLKAMLGGKISISELDMLEFKENGRSFPLSLVAMGVVNLGILALLIERQVIDKDSLVFIDEPEAHLHPAWQVEMAKVLFELSRRGVGVVIATHSVDILKWLEVRIKNHPEDEKLIALNKFPVNGDKFVEYDFGYKMAAIKGELTKPFADLYTAGL